MPFPGPMPRPSAPGPIGVSGFQARCPGPCPEPDTSQTPTSVDPAPAKNNVAVIEDDRLSRRHGGLRLVEGDVHLVITNLGNRGDRLAVAVADAGGRADR